MKAASFPVGIALARPGIRGWCGDRVALGQEARTKGARVLLGPTVNLHRSPLNGRNFECYSEDPHLSARMAVAYITGLQSEGVAATVKHFVGNESEFERMTISSEIDERTLREIYLPPFEAAVREAGTWAIMCAYNRLNGTYAGEHSWLIRDLLRREWGFDGVMMSDWFATHSTAPAAAAGLDLEMPGPTRYRGEQLVAAVNAGEVGEGAIEESARRVLRLIGRVGAFADPAIPEERAIDRPEHRALIRRAGAAGTVLLKNAGILPLDPSGLTSVAIIGPNARTARIMGGGSAQLNAHYRVSPYEGLVARLGPGVRLDYEIGCTNDKLLPLLRGPVAVEYFANRDLGGAVVQRAEQEDAEVMWLAPPAEGIDRANFSARLTATFTPDEAGEHHFGLISAGRSRLLVDGQLVVENWEGWRPGESYFGSGSDEVVGTRDLEAGRAYRVTIEYASIADGRLGIRAVRAGVTRPLGDEAIERAARVAGGADVALVFAGLNGEWDSEGADRPHIGLVGRQDELIERVAAANPRTVVVLQSGGPLAMPWLGRVAGVLQAWYPGQEAGNAIADVLFGDVEPGGRLPQTFPVRLEDNPAFINYPGDNGRVRYGEGIFVGYRYYDKKRIAPLFPFGFRAVVHDVRVRRIAAEHRGARAGRSDHSIGGGDE
ncbi:MAG: glycoside hydrolase family 3 C-terminal domain-containing protein [Thermomicrobiales bacterium]